MKRILCLVALLHACSDSTNDTTPSSPDDTTTTPTVEETGPDSAPDSGHSGSGSTGDTDTDPGDPDCSVGADPITVDGIATFTDLQVALDAASPGSVVILCAGTYPGTFVAQTPVNLVGIAGSHVTILDGESKGTTLTLAPESSVTGIRILGGSAPAGGGLVFPAPGRYTIEDSAVVSNTATEGGGVWAAAGARAWFPATNIADNTADRGAGIFADGAVDLDLTGAVISTNVANESGGGVYGTTGLTILGGTLTLNATLSLDDLHGGGGLYTSGDVFVQGTVIAANESLRGAGLRADNGVAELNDLIVSNNVAISLIDVYGVDGQGAGLYVANGEAVLTGASNISGNTADLGGGSFVAAGGTLTGALLDGNTATIGGGAFLQGGTGVDLLVTDNGATDGGGVAIDGAGSLDTSIVGFNQATGLGGGVLAALDLGGVVDLSDLTLSDNTATDGAGVHLTGEGAVLSLLGTTSVVRNVVTVAGGGAWVAETATLSSVGADWGDGADDNGPNDVAAGPSTYVGYAAGATFTCAAGVCDPAP